MKRRIAELILRLRWPILIATLLVTAAFATQLPKLQADDDVLQFLPRSDPSIALFDRVNEKFGGLDVAIVGLEAHDMFTQKRLEEVRAIAKRLGQVDGVYDVTSFTEVPDPQPGPMGLNVEPLVDRVPSDAAELEALKKKVLANENAAGNLISSDGEAAMILCFLGGKRAAVNIAADIKAASSEIWTGKAIYYAGSPFIRLHVVGGTKADMSKLTPVVIIAVLLVTFLMFPKPLGVILSLSIVGVALVWTLGLFVLLGKRLSIVDTSIPTLFIAIGGAYGIHFLGAYFKSGETTVRGRIIEAFSERVGPVSFSALATCCGFAAFQAMDVGPMRAFGWMAALGILFMLLLALTVIPAALSFSRSVPTKMGAAPLARSLGRLGGWSLRHGKVALASAVVLSAVSMVGVFRVEPDSTLSTLYSEGSEPDLANRFLDRHFGGNVMLQIYFEGDMRSPFVLAELRKIVEYLEQEENVVQVSSIIDPLVMMAEAMGGRPDLPISRERTQVLYPFIEGSAAIDQIISKDKDSGLVQVRLKNVSPDEINLTMERVKAFIAKETPKAVEEIDIRQLKGPERAERQAQLVAEISKRIVRLVDIYGGIRLGKDAQAAIAAAIRKDGMRETLSLGDDVARAAEAMIAEHISGEAALFEEPDPETADPATMAEWENRSTLAKPAFEQILLESATLDSVESALARALPLTTARDPKGLELGADAIVGAAADARAMIEAARLSKSVLAAAGVTSPSEELERRTSFALTDLDAPAYGFPSTAKGASRVAAWVTGQPVINTAFANSTTRNAIASLIVTFILLLILLTVAFRSIVTSLKALVPALVMFAVAIGVMGAAHVPLDPTTSMISAIALGVGVDYAIHFLWRRRRRGESLEKTAETIGPSIASNAIQVAVGFSVLAISDMIPMQRFGLLVAMTMVLSALATFILLPVLKAEGSLRNTD